MSLPLSKQLSIKYNSLKRLYNDYKSYHTEQHQLIDALHSYENQSDTTQIEPGIIRRKHEMITECAATIQDITIRLKHAYDTLYTFIINHNQNQELISTELWSNTQSLINTIDD